LLALAFVPKTESVGERGSRTEIRRECPEREGGVATVRENGTVWVLEVDGTDLLQADRPQDGDSMALPRMRSQLASPNKWAKYSLDPET
jgi:hypothetical protein